MSYSVVTKKIKKSKNLLFPLLGITKSKKEATFEPVNTYLHWEDICGIDCLELAALYDCSNSLFSTFEDNHILPKNPLGVHDFQGFRMYIFDLSQYHEDVNNFIQGKYSKFSDKSKAKIMFYHGDSAMDRSKMPMLGHDFKIIFYPNHYFKAASQELGVPISYLVEVGELLSVYDKEEETFDITKLNYKNKQLELI
jgi:hypothetical protein